MRPRKEYVDLRRNGNRLSRRPHGAQERRVNRKRGLADGGDYDWNS